MLRCVSLLALCFAAAAAAQASPLQELPQGTTETLHVSAQLVLLDASVTDRKTGKVLRGLSPQDFALTEDGAPQTVTSLSQDTLPLSIVFLFDATDTVRPVLLQLAMGARKTLDHLREGDEAAVASFSTHVTTVQKFTRKRTDMIFALGDASTAYDKDQATFIFEDLFEGTELAQSATVPNSRRVEVWLTDGSANDEDAETRKDHGNGAPAVLHTRAQAAELLGRSGVVISALVQESDLTRAQRAHASGSRFGEIEQFADETGGPVEHATASDAVERFASLLDALRQRYTLGYKPAQAKPRGTVCKLKLALSPAFFVQHPEVRPKDVVIRTRQSYTR